MKVVLQNLATKKYLVGDREWAMDPDEAFDFGKVVDALDYALGYDLHNVRAVLLFGDSRYNVLLPPVQLAEA
ncbi:MAG TPA: hypothetical protein VEC99_10805 [Clostridia bacterium]|nr:hypothetical protein [Clostridia bacterium]